MDVIDNLAGAALSARRLMAGVILLLTVTKMSFTNLEVQLIHKLVGELCRRRIPDHVKNQIRLSYTISNNQVVIAEERPFRGASSEWIVLEIAKLRYVRTRNEWELYWKRASEKWWRYQPHTNSKTLRAMIKEIDRDSDGCFFG